MRLHEAITLTDKVLDPLVLQTAVAFFTGENATVPVDATVLWLLLQSYRANTRRPIPQTSPPDRERQMLKEKIRFAPSNPESDISGEGYGASHNWKYGLTTAGRCSLYTCADCGEIFYHHYPRTPNIHQAIFEYAGKPGYKIPDACPKIESR